MNILKVFLPSNVIDCIIHPYPYLPHTFCSHGEFFNSLGNLGSSVAHTGGNLATATTSQSQTAPWVMEGPPASGPGDTRLHPTFELSIGTSNSSSIIIKRKRKRRCDIEFLGSRFGYGSRRGRARDDDDDGPERR
jgi:hypothetical protein